ncbi:MAG: hypothetical protein WBW33_36075 [Bryobacteraceae bacterium]
MGKAASRTRSVGTKVTEAEYGRLEALAGDASVSLSECVRSILRERLERAGSADREDMVLAELLALRTILVNLLLASAKKEATTAADLRAMIERADAGKWERARQAVAQPRAASPGGDWMPEFSAGGKDAGIGVKDKAF